MLKIKNGLVFTFVHTSDLDFVFTAEVGAESTTVYWNNKKDSTVYTNKRAEEILKGGNWIAKTYQRPLAVGDKVTINPLLEAGEQEGTTIFVQESMLQLKGQEWVIETVDNWREQPSYILEGTCWNWHGSFFEGLKDTIEVTIEVPVKKKTLTKQQLLVLDLLKTYGIINRLQVELTHEIGNVREVIRQLRNSGYKIGTQGKANKCSYILLK